MVDQKSWVAGVLGAFYVWPRGRYVRRFTRDGYVSHLMGEYIDTEWLEVTKPANYEDFYIWALEEEMSRQNKRFFPPSDRKAIEKRLSEGVVRG